MLDICHLITIMILEVIMELEEVASHESKDGWESHDYMWEPGGELPLPGDPRGFKIIIKIDDENYISTGVFESIEESLNSGAALAARYGLEPDSFEVILRAYYTS